MFPLIAVGIESPSYLEQLVCGVIQAKVVVALARIASASSQVWSTIRDKDEVSLWLTPVTLPKLVVLVKHLQGSEEWEGRMTMSPVSIGARMRSSSPRSSVALASDHGPYLKGRHQSLCHCIAEHSTVFELD